MRRVGAIVLAAGSSRRMGEVNKLTAEVGGRAIISRAIDALAGGGAAPIVVVTGHDRERVAAAVTGANVVLVHNPEHDAGMGTSIAAGVRALAEDVEAALIALGDMPGVEARTVAALVAAHQTTPDAPIAPRCDGRRGHPVLFPRSAFEALARLRGDRGAKVVYEAHPLRATIDVDDRGVLADIDTPAQLSGARARHDGTTPE